jgi:hypothetical protein
LVKELVEAIGAGFKIGTALLRKENSGFLEHHQIHGKLEGSVDHTERIAFQHYFG